MIASIKYQNRDYQIDLSRPIDVSIPLRNGANNPNAFFAPEPNFLPLAAGDFIGSIKAGSPVNFFNVMVNPHGNGTHTECLGHIYDSGLTINQALDAFFFPAQVITLQPEQAEGRDRIITAEQISLKMDRAFPKALLIRTLPNAEGKTVANYSGANPPYLHHEAARFLALHGILHLLVDLPSIDREEDGGKLLAHHAYWQVPENPRTDATITELIYLPDLVADGLYFLNIQIASFELDVSPSKPVLFEITWT